MREILFRGKNHENNQWVYGQYCTFLSGARIVRCIVNIDEHDGIGYNGTCYHIEDIETVGQFTGINGKNGVKIFEGDIVKVSGYVSKVIWDDNLGSWAIYNPQLNHITNLYHYCKTCKIEVIGNIHENPEILESK